MSFFGHKRKCVSLLVGMAFSLGLHSSEVDSWSSRDIVLSKDPELALQIVNDYTNQLMQTIVDKANARSHSCDEEELINLTYRILENRTGIQEGAVEYFIKNSSILKDQRVCIKDADSVYQDLTWHEFFASRISDQAVGCTLNIQGNVIGSDKFGHFFAQGYNYFVRTKKRGQFNTALTYGADSEASYFGFSGTGIYSYGDLNANFEGMRFWSQLTSHYTSPKKAYFLCEHGQWVQNRPFKWEEYFSAAVDEAVNTSYFRTNVIWGKFLKRVNDLDYSFPLSLDLCREVYKRHQHNKKLAKALVSPRCALMMINELPEDLQAHYIKTHTDLIDENKNQVTWTSAFMSIVHAIKYEFLFW